MKTDDSRDLSVFWPTHKENPERYVVILILIGLFSYLSFWKQGSEPRKYKNETTRMKRFILDFNPSKSSKCQVSKSSKTSGVHIQWKQKCLNAWFCYPLLVVYFYACAVIQSEFGGENTGWNHLL